jgi:hypothetical protein
MKQLTKEVMKDPLSFTKFNSCTMAGITNNFDFPALQWDSIQLEWTKFCSCAGSPNDSQVLAWYITDVSNYLVTSQLLIYI